MMTALEKEQAKEYSDIWSVIECIYSVLADFAKDYDIYAIAQELIFYKDGRLYANLQREDFWDVVSRFDLSDLYAGYERDWDPDDDRTA